MMKWVTVLQNEIITQRHISVIAELQYYTKSIHEARLISNLDSRIFYGDKPYLDNFDHFSVVCKFKNAFLHQMSGFYKAASKIILDQTKDLDFKVILHD